MSVRHPANGIVRFAGVPYDALVVTRIPAEGKLFELGLRDGDRIVAVDGEDLEDTLAIQRTMMKIRGQKEAVYTILRNGETVEITLPFAVLEQEKPRIDPGHRD